MVIFLFVCFFSIISCICVVRSLAIKYDETDIENYKKYEVVDSLRGYLALFVFFHHFIITYYWKTTGLWLRPTSDFQNNLGLVSVALFFMITGFLFVDKLLENKNEKYKAQYWLDFYIKRILRIVPLYVFSLFILFLFVAIQSDFVLNVDFASLLRSITKWFLFAGGGVNEYIDTRRIIAGVDWTLKYEWFFYFSLLPMSFILKSKFSSVALILAILSLFIYPEIIRLFIWEFDTSFFIVFLLGGGVAKLNSRYALCIFQTKFFTVIGLASLLYVYIFSSATLTIFDCLLLGLFFLLIVKGNNMFGVFSYKYLGVLGNISFSVYLSHGIILFFIFTLLFPELVMSLSLNEFMLFMPFMSVIIVVFSYFTYKYIEMPAMIYGKLYWRKGLNIK